MYGSIYCSKERLVHGISSECLERDDKLPAVLPLWQRISDEIVVRRLNPKRIEENCQYDNI